MIFNKNPESGMKARRIEKHVKLYRLKRWEEEEVENIETRSTVGAFKLVSLNRK